MRNFTGLLVALALGCNDGSDTDNDAQSNDAESGDVPGGVYNGTLEVIVPPDEDGNLPPSLWVGCEGSAGPYFQMSDLETIVPLAEGDPGGVGDAVESFLDSGEGRRWPQEDWFILRETEDEILLVHSDADGDSFMEVSREDDEWAWSGARRGGPCSLHYVTPQDLHTVDWRLDPETPPDPSATTVTVLVTEQECVSGQELGDRLLDPQVVLTNDSLRLAFAAEPPPGDAFTCPSNPETQVTVELPEPLGDREIIEGLAIGIDLAEYLR